jgi:hypothetical protein
MEWEVSVGAAQSCDEVVFEGAYGTFCRIASV